MRLIRLSDDHSLPIPTCLQVRERKVLAGIKYNVLSSLPISNTSKLSAEEEIHQLSVIHKRLISVSEDCSLSFATCLQHRERK